MNDQSEELFSYLDEIAEKSFRGDIPWNQSNPSTFQWTQRTDSDIFLVTIQKATNPRPKSSNDILKALYANVAEVTYLFQVHDRQREYNIITLSSTERPELAKVLAKIFSGAEKGMDFRSSLVLRKLLGKE